MTEIRKYTYKFSDAIPKAEGESINPEDYNFTPPPEEQLDAYIDLKAELRINEEVEGVVFGQYGWSGYGEDDCVNPIPKDKIGVLLTLEEARPLMQGWSFNGGFGSPECYATYVWTNQRVIWVTQYDGSTNLDSAPRHPMDCVPEMPGG